MRILVTGGAGYVGSHCVRALCDAGHVVHVLDNLSQGHRQAVDPRAAFHLLDAGDRSSVVDLMLKNHIEGVMHFAAYLDVNESVRDPLKYYENNVISSIRILQAMAEAEVFRMVFSSTCATYGQPERIPIVEDSVQHPISPYGRTKLAIEWMIRDCTEAWGVGGCALRYFNAAGASSDSKLGEDHDPETHLIPLVLDAAAGRRQAVHIFGTDYPTPDGTCVRDYIHVEDLADAHVLAMETQELGVFRFYNLGTGRGTSVKQIINTARQVTAKDVPSIETTRRPGDPAQLVADATRIKIELGWTPTRSTVRNIIESAWNWHQSHPTGYAE